MKTLVLGYLPLAKASWLDDRVKRLYVDSLELLRGIPGVEWVEAPGVVADEVAALEAIERFKERRVDGVLLQFITFTLGSIVPMVAAACPGPLLLWSLPEPPMNGGRIQGNSFCASNMNAHTLWRLGRPYQYLYGDLTSISPALRRSIGVLRARERLAGTRLGLVGYRVPGFYTSTFDELKLRGALGTEVHHLDLLELVRTAETLPTPDRDRSLALLTASGKKGPVSDGELDKAARLHGAFKALAAKYRLTGFAVKCWPEFGDLYGVAVCAVLGLLTGEGLNAACEGDLYGAVAMDLGAELSGGPTFYADFIHHEVEKNEGIFWHCGAAPCRLAAPSAATSLARHPVMDGGDVKGVTHSFPLKPGALTIFRLGEDRGSGYRMLISRAEGLPTEQILKGNPLRVRFEAPVAEFVETVIEQGFEHHYVLAYGDQAPALLEFCKWTGVRPVFVGKR